MTKTVAIITTSASELNGHPTGLWLEEAATPYYMFKEKGYQVVFASPKGGAVPIDAMSLQKDYMTSNCKKFMHDPDAFGSLSHSISLKELNVKTVDVVYLAGGHGTCVDFVNNSTLNNIIEDAYNDGKIVAADCHGVVPLAECLDKSKMSPLIKGKTVTGFCSSEEKDVQLASKVPFLIDVKFQQMGANYKSGPNWSSHVCVDGNLITGQNPQSSEECASAVIKAMA